MPEIHPAEQLVRRYIECFGALNAHDLAACFFPDAGLSGFLGSQAVAGSANLYNEDVQRMAGAGTDMSAYKAAVTAFDAIGNITAATVSMEGFAAARFVDYLHLGRCCVCLRPALECLSSFGPDCSSRFAWRSPRRA